MQSESEPTPVSRLSAAVAGKVAAGIDDKGRPFRRMAAVQAADVVAVAAPHRGKDPVAAALHDGAAAAMRDARDPEAVEVFQQVADLNRLISLAGA